MRLGSSPRGRGKHLREDRLAALALGRLIPARAGKTTPAGGPGAASRAHPRAGGENICARIASLRLRLAGSSPRGRGKPHRQVGRARPPGLIPARAGKTSGWVDPGSNWAAHPRAGGENGRSALPTSFSSGSSPRGRGKRESLVVSSGWGGLIPARAGKTVP